MNVLTEEEINALLKGIEIEEENEMEEESKASRILIVDDEPDYLSVLSRALKTLGYEVETAESGEEAIEKVMENPPHLMLLDVRMPGRMGGPEVLRRVKTAFPETIAIMVSAVRDHEIQAEAFESGASGYITKPFDFGYLKEAVASRLSVVAT